MSEKQKEFSFWVPGIPRSKQRARTLKSGRSYTPKITADYEKKVALCFLQKYKKGDKFTGPVHLDLAITMPILKKWSHDKQEAMRGYPHTNRPDLGNIQKAIEDALNGFAYIDDSQISRITEYKIWGRVVGIQVTITEDKQG